MRIPSPLAPAVAPALGSTAVATATTTASLLWFGKRHARTPWAPLDAVSHIAWGDRAFVRDELDVQHTLVGFVLNLGAVAWWSTLHALVVGRPMRTRYAIPFALASGAAVAATAYVFDFKVAPKRFTPGFEWKLPRRPLRKVYAVLAASFAAGSLLARAWR
ncbi:MAG: hypothetical protein HOV81_00420 [Kofleriaceae bacterium]|nr:hypothetical protein [Kofleriaceae bacterium]